MFFVVVRRTAASLAAMLIGFLRSTDAMIDYCDCDHLVCFQRITCFHSHSFVSRWPRRGRPPAGYCVKGVVFACCCVARGMASINRGSFVALRFLEAMRGMFSLAFSQLLGMRHSSAIRAN